MECLEEFNGSGECSFGACAHKSSGFPVGLSFTLDGSCTIVRLLFLVGLLR